MKELYDARVAQGDIHPDPAQVALLPEFDRIRDALAKPVKRGWFRSGPVETIPGLYIWGGVGRGKSMLMDLFVESVDVPSRRVHFHAFMQEIHASMHEARKRGVDDAIQPVAKSVSDSVRLLAFDEMQIKDITDAMIVGRLFEQLFEAGVVVVTTSNRPPDDLYKDGLNRQLFLPFIALLKERMTIWEMTSDQDYRQNRGAGGRVYFTPLNAEARAGIRDVWSDLAPSGGTPLTLRVLGRDLILPAHEGGAAKASFFDLCGQPLGPADYLAIAKAVDTLIIEEIPQLSEENFNQARRFVTLIDALYEAKVRLIASASAEPEALYVLGEGAFEFERTASRLREMQSADWQG